MFILLFICSTNIDEICAKNDTETEDVVMDTTHMLFA